MTLYIYKFTCKNPLQSPSIFDVGGGIEGDLVCSVYVVNFDICSGITSSEIEISAQADLKIRSKLSKWLAIFDYLHDVFTLINALTLRCHVVKLL